MYPDSVVNLLWLSKQLQLCTGKWLVNFLRKNYCKSQGLGTSGIREDLEWEHGGHRLDERRGSYSSGT